MEGDKQIKGNGVKKVTIYIAVGIPPGAFSKVELWWDKNEEVVKKKYATWYKANCYSRIEILKVEVEL